MPATTAATAVPSGSVFGAEIQGESNAGPFLPSAGADPDWRPGSLLGGAFFIAHIGPKSLSKKPEIVF